MKRTWTIQLVVRGVVRARPLGISIKVDTTGMVDAMARCKIAMDKLAVAIPKAHMHQTGSHAAMNLHGAADALRLVKDRGDMLDATLFAMQRAREHKS